MDHFLSRSYSPKVTVVCLTYNQEKYILDAMNGFSMQETSFPFVCVVMDDASTDGEQDVIRTYLQSEFEMDNAEHVSIPESEVIVCRHRKNPNCFFAVYLLTKNLWHTGKKDPLIDYWKQQSEYIALCEGDDYWTDPTKLQNQVDFLDSHPDYSMCFHAASIISDAEKHISMLVDTVEDREYFCRDIFPNWQIPTASVLYRPSAVFKRIKHPEWCIFGDISLFMQCCHTGRIWGMSEKMSVYRRHNNGESNSAWSYEAEERYCRHLKFLYVNYKKINKKWIRDYLGQHHYTLARRSNSFISSGVNMFKAFMYSPRVVFRKLICAIK